MFGTRMASLRRQVRGGAQCPLCHVKFRKKHVKEAYLV
jgi:hypothetical protein